ncbi:RING-H2 finger protein ATL8 [Lactuca sativa]|uniref:RING-type domain-containing protein n=1 Tax=Lactuca sativa TaxID=4236 RepID=A0A9R1WHI8_LACSA|nr:RING-H2 finger protein ATL8 [Lactuca sativa]KAJ0222566.1 hypothetical protein LSAT_V11C200051050 [Lactuca sativa]
MSHRFMILGGQYSPTPTPPEPTPDDHYVIYSSQFFLFVGLVIILFFLLCLIALNAAARCTCFRWFSGNTVTTTQNDHFSLPASKLLRSIPKLTYSGDSMTERFSDCAICLTEFVVGDEVRVLPLCSHCFHVACIDRWIVSHFTCPSCRQMLLKTTRCDRCNEVPVAGVTGTQSTAAEMTSVTIDRFLP